MTDEDPSTAPSSDDSSRRSFMKKGAFASIGLAAAGAGTAAGQVGDDGVFDDDDFAAEESDKALMFTDEIRPTAYFVITSPVLEWSPDVEAVQDNVWSDYNTRMIRYLNTRERAVWFQAHEAEVPNYNDDVGYVVDSEGDVFGENDTPQPEIFEMDPDPALFGESPWLMTVQFSPVGEDEEDVLVEQEEDWLLD